MAGPVRAERQSSFELNQVHVIVATVAFGMGIDKPDIRRVVHVGLPSSLEAYMQECGRAGRDGLVSECVAIFTQRCIIQRERALLYDRNSYPVVGSPLRRALCRVDNVVRFFKETNHCRRARLLAHQGEDPCCPPLSASQVALHRVVAAEPGFCYISQAVGPEGSSVVRCDRCDVCCEGGPSPVAGGQRGLDCRQELRILLRSAVACEPIRVSATELCQIITGRLPSGSFFAQRRRALLMRLRVFGSGQHFGLSIRDWTKVLEAALTAGYM